MLKRTLAALPVALGLLLLTGCSGVSVQPDEPDRPLPPTVERVVIVPDASWAREDPEAVEFMRQLVAQLRVRSAVRDYGVGFVFATESSVDRKTLAPGRDALWLVSRCDFSPRSTVHHTSPGAEAAPELEDEARSAAAGLDGVSETEKRAASSVRAFSFAVRGFVRTPGIGGSGPRAAGDRPMRVVSRIAVSGDCDFDEAVGSDDESLWFRDALGKIADSILDHMPRRVPGPGDVEEERDDDVPEHGGYVPGSRMPHEPIPAEHVHGELTPDAQAPEVDLLVPSTGTDERK